MTRPITRVQLMVLEFMHEFFGENDQLPTSKSIADHFGWKTATNARWHVLALKRCGYIEPNANGKYRFKRKEGM